MTTHTFNIGDLVEVACRAVACSVVRISENEAVLHAYATTEITVPIRTLQPWLRDHGGFTIGSSVRDPSGRTGVVISLHVDFVSSVLVGYDRVGSHTGYDTQWIAPSELRRCSGYERMRPGDPVRVIDARSGHDGFEGFILPAFGDGAVRIGKLRPVSEIIVSSDCALVVLPGEPVQMVVDPPYGMEFRTENTERRQHPTERAERCAPTITAGAGGSGCGGDVVLCGGAGGGSSSATMDRAAAEVDGARRDMLSRLKQSADDVRPLPEMASSNSRRHPIESGGQCCPRTTERPLVAGDRVDHCGTSGTVLDVFEHEGQPVVYVQYDDGTMTCTFEPRRIEDDLIYQGQLHVGDEVEYLNCDNVGTVEAIREAGGIRRIYVTGAFDTRAILPTGIRRVLKAAPVCPDCNGSYVYTGLLGTEPCRTCCGGRT